MARSAPVVAGTPTTAEVASGTTLTLSTPSGVQAGDVLVACLRSQTAASATDWTCAGWTRQGPDFVPSSSTYRLLGFYTLRVTDPGSLASSFTFTAGASGRMVGAMLIVRGVDPATLLAGSYSGYGGATSGTTQRAAAYAVSGACLKLGLFANENTGSNSATPTLSAGTSIAQVSNSTALPSSRTGLTVSAESFADATTTSLIEATWPAVSSAAAQSIALLGADSAAGTGSVALEVAAAADVRVVRAPVNVTSVLRTPGWTSAHRGCGTGGNLAEHSEAGYHQAANRGYPVLEMSVNRTSDGVWFGLHDQYLDRTSGVTGSVDPTTMTWAALQASYQITNGADGVIRPYYRLADLIATYGATHVLLLDPKYRHVDRRTEFLDICQAVGPDHCIVKFLGDNTSLAAAARARGLRTWGFLYEGDLANPNIGTWAAAWDILGMDLGASAGAWSTILGYGKPVMGHIAASQADYDLAISKGATSVQVGASQTVTAVGPAGEAHERTGSASLQLTATGTQTVRVAVTGTASLQIAATASGSASGGQADRTGSAALQISASATAAPAGGQLTRTGNAALQLVSSGTATGGTLARTGTALVALAVAASASISGGQTVRTGTAVLTLAAAGQRSGEHQNTRVLAVTAHTRRVGIVARGRTITIQEGP